MHTTVISTADLAGHLFDPSWVIVDCRFSLDKPQRGLEDYRQRHIPGASYAHLNDDLSSPVVPGRTGRHPLPAVDTLAETFGRWGITAGVQVVAYDDWTPAPGPAAARLWWLLRWLGHTSVAVLDGGWSLWLQEGRPVSETMPQRAQRVFVPDLKVSMFANAGEVERVRLDPAYRLVDVRSADRFRGENEVIDPVAGHIPGAISLPYADNLGPDGCFLPVDQLQIRFKSLLHNVPALNTIFYCGSGVTGAHGVLAYEHAGLGLARLYAGSWSEWITDPTHPIAQGA